MEVMVNHSCLYNFLYWGKPSICWLTGEAVVSSGAQQIHWAGGSFPLCRAGELAPLGLGWRTRRASVADLRYELAQVRLWRATLIARMRWLAFPAYVACANPALRSSTATRHACGLGEVLRAGNKSTALWSAVSECRNPSGLLCSNSLRCGGSTIRPHPHQPTAYMVIGRRLRIHRAAHRPSELLPVQY